LTTNFFDRILKLINRKETLIFSFFLFITIIIWFMKALEKNYTTDIDYPVRYRDFPEDKTLIGEVPDHLTLKVFAHGYILLQHKISSRYIPLVISVKSFSPRAMRGVDSGFYFLETRYLKDYIDKQLSSEFEILDVKPDTLIFPFSEVLKAKLPVKQNLKYKLDQQMILRKKPSFVPDSVEVTGPDYILDTLQYVLTRNRDLGLIAGDQEFDIALKPVKHTTFGQEKVKMTFEVEKFTEKSMAVPVSIINAPDSLRLITFPRQVMVTCQVGLSNYERLQAAMFKAVVDYTNIAEGQPRIKVDLLRSPEFVTAVRYSPKTVEYLIEK